MYGFIIVKRTSLVRGFYLSAGVLVWNGYVQYEIRLHEN